MTDFGTITQVKGSELSPTSDPAKSNRLRRARAIFTCACDMPADERVMFVEDSCGGDLALQELVRSLLRADEGGVSAWDCAGVEVASISPVFSLPSGYAPIRELGRGGAGVVQLCRETESGELVAVKLVHVESSGRGAASRFRREWRLLARLRHPALVALRSAGTLDGGCSYLVMDYIDGQDIRKHCREQIVPAHRRIEMLVPIAEALAVAHSHGIIHRDLKPGNILVERNGDARLIDFGAARVLDGDLNTRQENTLTGQIIGTLSYLSPEQAAGNSRHADHRSDLYQLAVVAYELLANKLPYDMDGHTSAEILRAIIAEPSMPLDATGIVEAGHPAVAFFERALSKEPELRFSSATEMADAMLALVETLKTSRSQDARSDDRLVPAGN
ncbi:MAG: serine/threonine-protein kinase [Planctomycetota bacterium]|nr:serine/threonine-protein kinase [Planctomycetota bacterium]